MEGPSHGGTQSWRDPVMEGPSHGGLLHLGKFYHQETDQVHTEHQWKTPSHFQQGDRKRNHFQIHPSPLLFLTKWSESFQGKWFYQHLTCWSFIRAKITWPRVTPNASQTSRRPALPNSTIRQTCYTNSVTICLEHNCPQPQEYCQSREEAGRSHLTHFLGSGYARAAEWKQNN